MLVTHSIETRAHDQMLDVTHLIQSAVTASGASSGVVTVFIPHTTAAVTINENADPDVVRDILKSLNKHIPWHDGYDHFEGNSAAHLKASFFGFSETLFFENGKLILGTWQSVYFCEFDGPRSRKLLIKVQPDAKNG